MKAPEILLILQVDFIHCDWAMCWMVFETFDVSSRPPYVRPQSEETANPYNALDGAGCATPSTFADRRVDSLSPMEMGCYDSKSANKH